MTGRTDDEIRAVLSNKTLQPPTARLMPFELLTFSVSEGWAEVAFDPDATFANPGGTLHGGIICSMLDDAMAVAASISMGLEGFAPLLQINVTFIKAAPIGRVLGRGAVLRKGNTAVHLQGALRLEPDGAPFAIATAVGVPRKF